MLYNSFIIFNRDLTLALQTLTGNVIPALFSKNNFYLQSFFVNSLHLWVSGSSSIRQESWRRVCLRPLASKIIGFYELINVIYYYRDCTVLMFIAASWTCLLFSLLFASCSVCFRRFQQFTPMPYVWSWASFFFCHPSLQPPYINLTRLQLFLYNSFSTHVQLCGLMLNLV